MRPLPWLHHRRPTCTGVWVRDYVAGAVWCSGCEAAHTMTRTVLRRAGREDFMAGVFDELASAGERILAQERGREEA